MMYFSEWRNADKNDDRIKPAMTAHAILDMEVRAINRANIFNVIDYTA